MIMRLLAILSYCVLPAASQSSPPSPPGTYPCKITKATFASLGPQQISYDLSPLKSQGDVDIPGTGDGNPHFHVRMCESIDTPNVCSGSDTPPAQQAVVQTIAANPPCYVTGDTQQYQWALQSSDPMGGVKLTLSGGDGCAALPKHHAPRWPECRDNSPRPGSLTQRCPPRATQRPRLHHHVHV